MKSFQAIIIAAIFASAAAANEPVASPAAANIERELDEHERVLFASGGGDRGTGTNSPPSPTISRGVSHLLLYLTSLCRCDVTSLCDGRHRRAVAFAHDSTVILTISLYLSFYNSLLTELLIFLRRKEWKGQQERQ